MALLTWDGDGVSGRLGLGEHGWDNTWLSDGDGGWSSHGNLLDLANLLTDGDGQGGWLWAVGGVASDSHVGGDGGDVSVSSQSGGRQSGDSSESRELHFSE